MGRELAIPNLPILMALNMAIKIWPFSTRLVPSIAYFARTGIIETRRCRRAKSVLQSWLPLLTTAPSVYATLVATPNTWGQMITSSGITKLLELTRQGNIVLMCKERTDAACHRRYIVETLTNNGIKTIPI